MNPKMDTVEVLLARRKNVHLGSCKLMRSDLKTSIDNTAAETVVHCRILT